MKLKNSFKKTRKNLAFTLVELLVTISVIGVLTTVLMINFVGSRERAKDSQKVQNLNSMKNALRLYYNDNQSYPADDSDLKSENYMSSSGYDEVSSCDGYQYELLDSGDAFRLRIELESGAGLDWGASQLNCGIGTTEEKIFAVCSN